MPLKIDSREKSFFLIKMLHIFDCLLVVELLYVLTKIHIATWSKYYSYLAICSFILSFFCFYSVKLYRPWRGIKLLNEFVIILKAWGVFIAIIVFIFFMLKLSEKYSRAIMISWMAICPFAIFLVHLIMRKVLHILRKRGKNLRFAIIVGAGDLGLRLARHIDRIPWAGIRMRGFFDDEKSNEDILDSKRPLLGKINQLQDYLKNNIVDYIYIALPLRAESKIVSIVNNCRTFGAEIYIVPDLFAFNIFNAGFQTLGEMLVITFNPTYRWKRYFDIIFSLIILIISLPYILLIALFIKIEDGGPVFYGHERITLAGKVFKCWKFRTMVINADKKLAEVLSRDPIAKAEWEKNFKLKNDPRVTIIGKFLRRTSLDEIPQFFNVLIGDMCVVGARPIVEKELNEYYKKMAGIYCSMKPGITGPWQIGKRNDIENYDERVSLDMWYIKHLSFWLDLKIILKTATVVFRQKGAY